MSERLTVSSEVTIYIVRCSACKSELEFDAKVDRDGDITIDAAPCDRCATEVSEAAFDRGRKEAGND